MQKNTNLFQKAATLQASHTPFVMVTIIKSLGSTPRHHGKMLVQTNGSIEGTIGGGPAEARAIKEALNRLESGESGMAKYVLNRVADASGTASSPEAIQPAHPVALASGGTGDISGTGASSAEVLPMECGGGLELLFEVYGKASTLVLIGGGHVNFEIGQLGHRLGYRIVVVDSRAEFSSSERFPFAWKCITSENAEELFSQVSLGSHDAIIIATPNHDESSLRQILNKINSLDTPLGFLGMIGSRNKVLRIKQRLLADGFTPAQVKALRSPVGLDIGAETPEEIAVSVMAEVMSVMHGTTAKPLSQKFADLVVVRGGGDLASGVIHKLFRAGMPVVVLEQEQPTVIRRTVSFAEAVFQGQTTVEGVTARRIENPAEFRQVLDAGQVPVLVDPDMQLVKRIKPTVLIDATLAKRNMGISKDLAGKVLALGPGFEAGKDVNMVIETSRGH